MLTLGKYLQSVLETNNCEEVYHNYRTLSK